MSALESNSQKEPRPIIQDDEIDLIQLAHTIWDHRTLIFKTTMVCVLIGLMIAIFSPVKYTASATLLPQADSQSGLGKMGNLGGLASLAGINLSSMMGSASGIQPELYPQVVGSLPFLMDLLHQPYSFEDEKAPISLYQKRLADTIPSIGTTLLKYTVKLPWTLKKVLAERKLKGEQSLSNTDSQLVDLSLEEQELLEKTAEVLTVDVDDKTGLVTLRVEFEEPLLTAQVAQKTVELLQKYIISYKTKQVRDNLEFITDRYNEKKAQFETIQKAFFEYRDRHHNIVTDRADTRFQELSDAYDLAAEVYRNLAQQREQAEIAVKNETPAFSVIEPVQVPLEKAAPKRSMILIVSVFLGGFIGVILIFARILWQKLRETW